MTEKYEALRLADALEKLWLADRQSSETREEAAAELRRLHELNQELLEALKQIVNSADDHQAAILTHLLRKACAAIERAEGQA
jgi:hypothetical protein